MAFEFIDGLMKGLNCSNTFTNLVFQLKFISVYKPVSLYFRELWIGPKFICLIIYFSNFCMEGIYLFYFIFKVRLQKQYFILFSSQGNLMTDNTTVSELTCTYSSFKEKNLCQLCKVARTTWENLRILLLKEQHFSCCCINYITLYLSHSSGEKWQLSCDTSLENCHCTYKQSEDRGT